MANRWAVKSGNWSDTTVWNTGSILGLPTASDVVYPATFTVTVDQNITVTTLINTGFGNGGTFLLNNGITASANINTGVLTDIVQITGSNSAMIIGNLSGGATRALTLSGDSNATVIGNITAGNGAVYHAVTHNSTGNLIISGNVAGAAAAQAFGINQTGNGNIYVTGSIYSNGTATAAHGIQSIGTVNNIYVKGVVTGSLNNATYGINKTSIGILSINGNCLSRTGSAIGMTSNGTLIISGTISSSIAAPGVQSSGTTAINLFTGPFYNTGSFNAVYAYRMQMIEPASTTWRFDTDTGGTKTLYTSNQLPGVPRQTDVRKGTQYNFGLTGSLEMPDPSVVQAGVAVDNTTGSAIFTAQDMFNVLTKDIITTGSIGETLKNASSVQTVGATISAFKV